MMSVDISSLLTLPAQERLEIIDQLWESLAAESAEYAIPDWHREGLDRRIREDDPNEPSVPWRDAVVELSKELQ